MRRTEYNHAYHRIDISKPLRVGTAIVETRALEENDMTQLQQERKAERDALQAMRLIGLDTRTLKIIRERH